MKQEYLNNDFTVMENFKNEKITSSLYLRLFSGSFLFFLNFMNFYWNRLIDRELAQKLYLKMVLKLYFLPLMIFLISIFNVVILMLNKTVINQYINDVGLIVICLIIPILIILLNPLLIFWAKKSMIQLYYKNYYKEHFNLLKEPIVKNYYITDLTEWKKSYFKIFRNKETKIWFLTSDYLVAKNKNFIRINFENTLEWKNEQKNLKIIYKNNNIFHFKGFFIKWIFLFLFLSHKLFFVKNVYQKYAEKISIKKFIFFNWLTFIIFFIAPLTLITIFTVNGSISDINLIILSYFSVIFLYPFMICPIRFYIVKKMI
ncbi:hypothetical protein [Mesomycoplasma molare]|uniref:Uncharacterized protein n=1 Tax=Mesomycoplasma molare TaxID=171288 RepID=A0ABY5TUA9_9BACT|nr:hypothetical protein [Mesomycoplasma molare]UWD33899.1 hypothetical protein NX772_02190 [Mesomycoplasma molare]